MGPIYRLNRPLWTLLITAPAPARLALDLHLPLPPSSAFSGSPILPHMARPSLNRAASDTPGTPRTTTTFPARPARDIPWRSLDRVPTLKHLKDDSYTSLNDSRDTLLCTPESSFESLPSLQDLKTIDHLDPALTAENRDVVWFGRPRSESQTLRPTKSTGTLTIVDVPVSPPAPLNLILPPIPEEEGKPAGVSRSDSIDSLVSLLEATDKSHSRQVCLPPVGFEPIKDASFVTPQPLRIAVSTPYKTPVRDNASAGVSTPCRATFGTPRPLAVPPSPPVGLVKKRSKPVQATTASKAPPPAPKKAKVKSSQPFSRHRAHSSPDSPIEPDFTDPFAAPPQIKKRSSVVKFMVDEIAKGYAGLTMRDPNRENAAVHPDRKGKGVMSRKKSKPELDMPTIDIDSLVRGRMLGSGSFGDVYEAADRTTGAVYAVKTLSDRNDSSMSEHRIEAAFLQYLGTPGHAHIVHYVCSSENPDKHVVRIVTELCPRGDLKTFLMEVADAGGLGEARTWKVLAEVVAGLAYIHGRRVCHVDVKPDNIYIMADGSLKIGDFGCAGGVDEDGFSTDAIPPLPKVASDGSHHWKIAEPDHTDLTVPELSSRPEDGEGAYMSPDCRKGTHSDIFSLGIMMIEIALNVVMPSGGEIFQALRSDTYCTFIQHFTPRFLKSDPLFDPAHTPPSPILSPDFVDFISYKMLASNPNSRATAAEIQAHPTIQHLSACHASPALADEDDQWYLDYLQMPPPPPPSLPPVRSAPASAPETITTPASASTEANLADAAPSGRRPSMLQEVRRKTSDRALALLRGAKENRASISGKFNAALGTGIPVSKAKARPVSLAVAVSQNDRPSGDGGTENRPASNGRPQSVMGGNATADRSRSRAMSRTAATSLGPKQEQEKPRWKL